MTTIQLALRTYVRYVVPLTLLSAIALLPIAASGALANAPVDADGAKAAVRLAWLCAAVAWMGQLWLVAAAAHAGRALASDTRLSQLRAFTGGAVAMARAIVPVGVALAAIVAGSLALVLPGLALFALFALVGASDGPRVSARLADSATTVRAALVPALATLAAMIAIDLVIVPVAQALLVAPLPKKPTPADFAGYRALVRAVAFALVIVSPSAAAMLAAIRVTIDVRQPR